MISRSLAHSDSLDGWASLSDVAKVVPKSAVAEVGAASFFAFTLRFDIRCGA